jgi:hypothetical protein
MKNALIATALGCALVGCVTTQKKGASKPPVPPPVVTPLTPILGKVLVVNTDLKYIVADFSLSRPPKPGDVYDVIRMGMKVGEARINENPTAANYSADIIAGEAKVGDEVRKD